MRFTGPTVQFVVLQLETQRCRHCYWGWLTTYTGLGLAGLEADSKTFPKDVNRAR
jgi:hypothetical protein